MSKPKVPPTFKPTVLPPSCSSCLNHVLEQLEAEGLSRPKARAEAERKTRMVWVTKGELAICRICNSDVVPNRATRRATWTRPKPNRGPIRTPEIEANLEKVQAAETKRRTDRNVRRATKRLEGVAGDAVTKATNLTNEKAA